MTTRKILFWCRRIAEERALGDAPKQPEIGP